MTKAQHTPGQKGNYAIGGRWLDGQGGEYEGFVGNCIREANAHLIAAAPDSHEANISALVALDQAKNVLYNAYAKDGGELPHRKAAIDLINRVEDEIYAAIAKAKGE